MAIEVSGPPQRVNQTHFLEDREQNSQKPKSNVQAHCLKNGSSLHNISLKTQAAWNSI